MADLSFGYNFSHSSSSLGASLMYETQDFHDNFCLLTEDTVDRRSELNNTVVLSRKMIRMTTAAEGPSTLSHTLGSRCQRCTGSPLATTDTGATRRSADPLLDHLLLSMSLNSFPLSVDNK